MYLLTQHGSVVLDIFLDNRHHQRDKLRPEIKMAGRANAIIFVVFFCGIAFIQLATVVEDKPVRQF